MGGIDSEDNATQISYASFGRRLLAWLIDSLIMGVLMVPVMSIAMIADVILLASMLGPNARSSPFFGGIGYVFWVGFGFCLPLLWLYYACMESSVKRATLGKLICGLQVVNQQGKTISFGKASVRIWSRLGHTVGFALLTFLLVMITAYLISGGAAGPGFLSSIVAASYVSLFGSTTGYVFAYWTPQKQTLHDLMAGTVVVKKIKETPSGTVASVPFSPEP